MWPSPSPSILPGAWNQIPRVQRAPIATFLYEEESSLAHPRFHGNPSRCKVEVMLYQRNWTLRLAQRGPSLTGVRGDPPFQFMARTHRKPQAACLNTGASAS